jgi:hypothetical protein
VKSVVPCNDQLKYASLRAEPNFRYLTVTGTYVAVKFDVPSLECILVLF